MEKNINLAKILNGKPVNTKLWSPLFGDVYISSICSEDTIIVVNHHAESSSFYNNGKYFNHPESEPLLFPSKLMRDWRKFAWKKGDILLSKDNDVYIIFEKFEDDAYTKFKGKHYLWKECNVEDYNKEESQMLTSVFEKATDDVAQTYIKTIEEHLDGKLNLETLEIEKQPEFKDGDIVVYGKSVAICRRIYKHTISFYVSLNEMFGLLFDDEVESSEEYIFAKEQEKKKLFDALAKENKAWDSEKKQIVDLKPKVELKPFDKVLVRDSDDMIWCANIFSHMGSHGEYVTIGLGGYHYCIPYNKETAKLIGTTDDWKG